MSSTFGLRPAALHRSRSPSTFGGWNAAPARPRHAGVVSDISQVDRDVAIERVELGGGAWVDVARGWVTDADAVGEHLLASVPWQTSQLFRYDHVVEERRLGSWWKRGNPLPHPALADATRALQHRYRVQFDGFGLIQYRDGNDGQAFHRDTDMRWLDDTVIAVLTFGARRPWLLRPYSAKHTDAPGRGATHDLAPGPGDLIVMGGRCQRDWEHSVPYMAGSIVGPRVSTQWRFAHRTGRPFQGGSYRAPLTYSRPR